MTESFFLLFSFCRLSGNSKAWPGVRTHRSHRGRNNLRGIAVIEYLFLCVRTYASAILKLPAMFAMHAPILIGIAAADISGG